MGSLRPRRVHRRYRDRDAHARLLPGELADGGGRVPVGKEEVVERTAAVPADARGVGAVALTAQGRGPWIV